MANTSNLHGVGRRKSSIARVWLTKGKGGIMVNGKKYDEYFSTDASRMDVVKPLSVTNNVDACTIKVNVHGGGVASQAGAVRLGIARALLSGDENLRSVLRQHGLLTVDSRVKERKKYGQRGARAKFQFVKR